METERTPIFTDNANRIWDLSVSVGTVRRVKTLLGIDLTKAIEDPELVTRLGDDLETFVNVLFAIVKPQADAAEVTDEQFGEALGGDALDAAATAFLVGLIDFFPKAKRAVLDRIVQRATQYQTATLAKINEAIDNGILDDRLTHEFDVLASINQRKATTKTTKTKRPRKPPRRANGSTKSTK